MGYFQPGYKRLLSSGELKERVGKAYKHLTNCDICPLACGIDRTKEDYGTCKTGGRARISSYGPHFGEEYPLRGIKGSGTIFFSGCNLQCQYCQNYDISQRASGKEIDPEDLAFIMLELQDLGCHNINLVSPSHVVPQILSGVLLAANAGLEIPLVYNCGGYDSMAMLRLLEGVVDIYMPDMKYTNDVLAKRYSKIAEYTKVNQKVVKEMHNQVGDLKLDDRGIATRGLLVRHLILPVNLAGTDIIVKFLAKLSTRTYLNLMDQYHPSYKAHLYPKINRRVTHDEYQRAIELAKAAGLTNLDKSRKSHFDYDI
jgi:putative pyruvate formate lyase activating enzyme